MALSRLCRRSSSDVPRLGVDASDAMPLPWRSEAVQRSEPRPKSGGFSVLRRELVLVLGRLRSSRKFSKVSNPELPNSSVGSPRRFAPGERRQQEGGGESVTYRGTSGRQNAGGGHF